MEENLHRIYSGEMDLSSENEKTTLTVDEPKDNYIDLYDFAKQVDDAVAKILSPYNALKVCDTPDLLLQIGCEQLPMLYTQKHLRNALHEKDPKNSDWHGLTIEQIKALPEYLSEPVILMDSMSRNDSIVAVLNELDNDSLPLVVSIRPNGKGIYNLEQIDSNFITSYYGREKFVDFLSEAARQNNLLYWNEEKSRELFMRIDKKMSRELLMFQGVQFPKAFNNLDSNIIIHKSNNIVKPLTGNSDEKSKINNERKSNMRVFFDMDGTLNKITDSLMDENGSVQIEKMYKTENFFEHIEPEKNMIELANKLSEQSVEVFSLSSCELGDPPGFEKQKDKWLDKHNVNIAQENRIYVPYGEDKTNYIPGGLQDGDVLVDDYNLNLEEWQKKAADKEVNAKAVKVVNSLNDKGLGALGGDKGNIWDGDRIYTSFSADLNANTILNIFSESKPEEIKLEVNTNHKKIMYDAYYYLDMIGSDGLANIEVQSGSRALFSVLQPPNSEQAYLICDNYDTDGYSLSNFKAPFYFKDKQSAVNEFVFRQAVDPKGSDDCLLMFKEDELNKAIQHVSEKFPEVIDTKFNDRLSKLVGSVETADNTVKPEYKYGLETLSVRKVSGTKTYEVYGLRDGNEKYLFSSDAPTVPFFVDQINSTISANRYRTDRKDMEDTVQQNQDNEAMVLDSKKFHR